MRGTFLLPDQADAGDPIGQLGEIARLRDREAATREVLEIISRSPDDELLVFDAILGKALHLCGAMSAGLVLGHVGGPPQRLVAHLNSHAEVIEMYDAGQIPMDPERSTAARAIVCGEVIHLQDMGASPAYHSGIPHVRRMVDDHGVRTNLLVPLIGKEGGIGALILYKQKVAPFSDDEIALVQIFAAQAVIAIENVRQFRELQNRLAREAATREILEVISRHPDDEQPVFDAIIESAARLCDAPFAGLMLRNDPDTHLVVAASKTTNSGYIEMLRENPHSLADPNSLTVEAVKAMQVRQYPDIEALENYERPSDQLRITWDLERMRTLLYVPLIRGDRAIGTLVLWRQEVNEFSEDDIELLKIFAAQAVIAIENVRQFRELQTRLEREAATREILSVISQSRDDEKPVFDTILECATRLIGSPFAGLHMLDKTSGMVRMVAHVGLHAKTIEAHDFSAPIDEPVIVARAVKECAVMHRPDLTEGSLYAQRHPLRVAMVDVEGARTALVVPLVSDGAGIGCIWVFRREVRSYQEDEIALLQSFAAQAVIAIENVHQFREVQERLQREKAMSDVLSVISKSRDDEQPVFDVIVERARVLCKADISGLILGHEGGPPQRAVAQSGVSEQMLNAYRDGHFSMDPELSAGAKAIIERRVVLMEDAASDEIYHRGGSDRQEAVLRERIRSNLHVPLISDGKGIGCLVLARMEVRPYLPEEIALVETFAAQAVIAIENVRQFRAIRTANSELEARLEREAATREILEVISTSRDDETPVFDVIIENARRLCEANMAAFVLGEEGGGPQVMVANRGTTEETLRLYREGNFPMDPEVSLAAQAIISRQTLHLHDMGNTDAYKRGHPNFVSLVDQQGIRTNLLVPLVAQGRGIGCLILFRTEVRPYSKDQIALVETFAAQAVIAIQNVRQFKALEASNADLAVSLERQTATAGVLDVISQAQTDVQPVFETILQAASRLCEAPFAGLYLADETRSEARQVASLGARSEYLDRPDAAWPLGNPASVPRSIAERRVIHIEDLADTDLYRTGDSQRVAAVEVEGMRTYLAVPLRLGDRALGCIGLYRREPRPFSADQVTLVEAFAAQAVIAIENVRQFRAIQEANQELETRLEREKASRQILSVISENRDDEKPVFDVILENATRLCNAQLAFLSMANDERTHLNLEAHWGDSFPGFVAFLRDTPMPLDAGEAETARAVLEGRTIQIEDLRSGALYERGQPHRITAIEKGGVRTLLIVPLISNGVGLGVLNLWRTEVSPFSGDEIALVEAFAAQAVIAIENVRQFRAIQAANAELQTRLKREQATGEVLSVINRSRDDQHPVFRTILESASRLCDAPLAMFGVVDEARNRMVVDAYLGASPEYIDALNKDGLPLDDPRQAAIRAVTTAEPVQILDMREDDLYRAGVRSRTLSVDMEGIRTFLAVPIMAEDRGLGVIVVFRREVRAFDDDQISLLKSFAAQAAIAIENARQFLELQTRLEREEASREILGVISESRDDELPVFDAILKNASTLCNAPYAALILGRKGDAFQTLAANIGDSVETIEMYHAQRVPMDPDMSYAAQAIHECRVIHLQDLGATDYYRDGSPPIRALVDDEGVATVLFVPLVAGREAIGVITLFRREVDPFDQRNIDVVETFAAQAVIAIENVRQFRAIQTANSELGTRLEREEATREVLQVISRSRDDENPVFDAILKQARRLCGSPNAFLFLRNEADTHLEIVSHSGARSEFIDIMKAHPQPVDDPNSHSARAVFHNQVVHIEDLTQDQFSDTPTSQRRIAVDVEGMRTLLIVPLVAGEGAIGSILLYRREVSPFADDEIRLVQSFAAQAVIAIENVHQFRALNTRLEHEAATGEVLTVISQSREDDKPVFEIILEKAAHLCKAPHAFLQLRDATDTHLQIVAQNFRTSAFLDLLRSNPIPLRNNPGSVSVLGMNADTPTHYDDISALKGTGLYTEQLGYAIDAEGMRTALTVPLISGGRHIGVIALYKHEVSPFKQDEISLVQLFAEQAVIAIENSRQFRALQSQLQREEATSQILGVISQSREDEKAVFDTILSQASRLCDAPLAALTMGTAQDSHIRLAAHIGAMPEQLEMFENDPPPMDPKLSLAAQSIIDVKTIHVRDMVENEVYTSGSRFVANTVDQGGMRTCVWVPLRSSGQAIGAIALYRRVVQPFTDEQIVLVETFAAQAVIAVENVRQLRALVEARDAAEAALADLKKAQERLIQSEKMASLGQLTAGIAHEIKNPLNFVNNFAKLSDELLAELGEILEDQIKSLDDEDREDAEDLFRTVRENLGKINQHGRRADSIIKNMLLHSREGPSERQRRALNPIVEEALNLAYHGARAENSSFNIDMQPDLAVDAGDIDCYPQDLMRVFLNLISNGMYAAHKRSLTEDGFAPVISVTSRVNGDRIEVDVRDNGMGIPDDLREKIFTPFFTTKPAGEGTGLGLSLSYDIVVKQHGGDLTVDSKPGQFTVFRTSFPRTLPAKIGGET